jgi:hypothetical protein
MPRRTDWKMITRQLERENAEQQKLLRQCELVLALVPAQAKQTLAYTDGFLRGLQTDYIAPLMKKLRDQA